VSRWGKSSCASAGECALHEWTGNPDEGGPVAPARAIDPGRDARAHMRACTGAGNGARSIESRLEKVEEDVDGHEKGRGARLCRRCTRQRRGNTPRLRQILCATKCEKVSVLGMDLPQETTRTSLWDNCARLYGFAAQSG
jgi:hypothetical protein